METEKLHEADLVAAQAEKFLLLGLTMLSIKTVCEISYLYELNTGCQSSSSYTETPHD